MNRCIGYIGKDNQQLTILREQLGEAIDEPTPKSRIES